jgi:hypothetical protein
MTSEPIYTSSRRQGIFLFRVMDRMNVGCSGLVRPAADQNTILRSSAAFGVFVRHGVWLSWRKLALPSTALALGLCHALPQHARVAGGREARLVRRNTIFIVNWPDLRNPARCQPRSAAARPVFGPFHHARASLAQPHTRRGTRFD